MRRQMFGVHLRTWRFVLVLVIVVSVVAHVGQCEAEVEELRESRGGDYVPLNSLTISSLYKQNPKSGESRNRTPSFKPWWADLQLEVNKRRESKRPKTEKPSIEKSSTEKSSIERSSTEKSSTEKSSTEKSLTEKRSTENHSLNKISSNERHSSTDEISTENSSNEESTTETSENSLTKNSSTEESPTESSLNENSSTENSSTKELNLPSKNNVDENFRAAANLGSWFDSVEMSSTLPMSTFSFDKMTDKFLTSTSQKPIDFLSTKFPFNLSEVLQEKPMSEEKGFTGANLGPLVDLDDTEENFFSFGSVKNNVQLQNKEPFTLENLTERWHGINESVLNSGSTRPDSKETTTNPSFISSSIKNFLAPLSEDSEIVPWSPEAHHQQHSALAFVQHALAKEEEYDIAPLATLTTSVARRTTTQPRITTTKTTTSTTTRTTTSYSPPMIPDSYTVPDEEYTKRTFDRFIFMLKQDGAKMSKIPLRNIKIVFFNLLVDVGQIRDDRTNERLVRHYVTHFKRKHLDNKRRFLLGEADFNRTSELVDKLIFDFVNDSVFSDSSVEAPITVTPSTTPSSSDDSVTQSPYAPISAPTSSKKASIIKLENPSFSIQHSVEISRKNPATTATTKLQTSRSSEPTPTITSDQNSDDNNNNKGNNNRPKESVPWPNFYFELPSLEESLSKEILTGGSKVFGGVSSNTVRPVNSYGPWSSKKNKTETENSSQDQDKTQKVEAESDDSNDIQQPQRDPSHLDPNTNPDRFSSNIFEEIFQDPSLQGFPNFEELNEFGSSAHKVSDGFDEYVQNNRVSTTTERFDMEVIKPGRPTFETVEHNPRNNASIFEDRLGQASEDDESGLGFEDFIQNLTNDRLNNNNNNKRPVVDMNGENDKRLNGSSIFNDRLGDFDDEEFGIDDVIQPGRPSLDSDDVIQPGRPDEGEAEPEIEDEDDGGNHHYGSANMMEIENGRPSMDELEEENEPHPEETDYEDYRSPPEEENSSAKPMHQFQSFHLLNRNQTSHKVSILKTSSNSNKSEDDMPKRPSYFPQLASHYSDQQEDSELYRLRPNFTQTLQGVYPHHNIVQSTRKPVTSSRAPSTWPTTSWAISKRPSQSSTSTRPLPLTSAEQQLVLDSLPTLNMSKIIDRFSADILDPKPNVNKLLMNKNISGIGIPNWNLNPSGQKLTNTKEPENVVSIDEWKAILIDRLTSAISKVAASQGSTSGSTSGLTSGLNSGLPFGLSSPKQTIPDLGIIDDNFYLHRQQDLPEKNASSVTVNVWDYVEGNLKPVGQKEIPQKIISSGNPDRLDYEDYENFYDDFLDELFDNDIPPPARESANHPIDSFGVGNKSPRPRPAPTLPTAKKRTPIVESPPGYNFNFPFGAPLAVKTETHNGFSKIGTFSSTTTQPPKQTSAAKSNSPYGTPLRNKAGLSPPVAIASVFGIPMNISFIQDDVPDITSSGPVHIPPELKLFGELATYIAKTEKTPNVPEDLAQTNQFLNIYPIRRQTTTTTTTTTTTATTFDLDTPPEDFYDNIDRRYQNNFPRWQNFPFSAESIQNLNGGRYPPLRRPQPIKNLAKVPWLQDVYTAGTEDLSQAGSVPDRSEQEVKPNEEDSEPQQVVSLPGKTGTSGSRFKSPPVIVSLPEDQKKKEEEESKFLILKPQVIPHPLEKQQQQQQQQQQQLKQHKFQQQKNSDLIYDSNHLSYKNPISTDSQILKSVLKNQLRRGKK